MKRVAFYCQHVLGIGHLVRSTEILRALSREFSVLLIGGGRRVEGFRFPGQIEVVTLPALETDPDFGALESVAPNGDLESIQKERKEILWSVLERFAPHAFILELFPFGRKRFAFELIPALERVRARSEPAKVICSLRDILVTKRDQAAHEEHVCELINRYFDYILVHGDPRFLRLEASFSRVEGLDCPVEYTGYVVQAPETCAGAPDIPQEPFLVATIGSGRYRNGHKLLEAVIEAAPLLGRRIVIFAGPFIPDGEMLRLGRMAERQPSVRLDRYTPNLLPYLQRAELSISMGGYNTIMNILNAGTRAIVFPYTANGDQEQYIRAEKLHSLGAVEMIHPEDLEPSRLAGIIHAVLQKHVPPVHWRMDGAKESVRFIANLLHSGALTAEAPGA